MEGQSKIQVETRIKGLVRVLPKSDATRFGDWGRRATWDPQRTDSTVGHGDGLARSFLHQVHELPEELAGVGSAGAVKLVLRGNAGGGGQDRQSHEGDGGGGARHGCGSEVDEVGDVVIRYDRSLGLFLVREARGEKWRSEGRAGEFSKPDYYRKRPDAVVWANRGSIDGDTRIFGMRHIACDATVSGEKLQVALQKKNRVLECQKSFDLFYSVTLTALP